VDDDDDWQQIVQLLQSNETDRWADSVGASRITACTLYLQAVLAASFTILANNVACTQTVSITDFCRSSDCFTPVSDYLV